MAVPDTIVSTPASLYVGDLHPDVSDGQLFDAFRGIDNLASVRVCRDSLTARSLGYGYVNFITTDDANRAIEKLNHTPLNGQMIRVMWSHRDPDARKSGLGNLFVKNLNDSINNVKLHEMFSKYGNILSCKVAMSQEGKSKGYGFVQFETEESANAAIDNVNGFTVEGKQIYVGHFMKKSDRSAHHPDAKFTNLFIKNLDMDVTEELLKEKFSEFGKITHLAIMKDNSEKSRGFGFVNFDTSDGAKEAMEAMNGTQLGSKVVYVARAQKKAEREKILHDQFEERRNEQIQKYKGSNVYVKNIDDGVNDDDLRDQFSQCGTITSAKVMRDDKGVSRGFGFVCFSTPEEAKEAVNTLHGYVFHGKPLYVAIAQKKEDRQAQLQLQFSQGIGGLAVPPTTIIPAGYPPLYYTAPPSVVPQQGIMYQPLGLRPEWRTSRFVPPARPTFHSMPRPMVPDTSRQYRKNRGRMNGHMLPQSGGQSVPFVPQMQQPNQSMNLLKDISNQQNKYKTNGKTREMSNGPRVTPAACKSVGGSAASHSQGSEKLSSMLAAASPQHQKQMLGECLYPLVLKLKHDLAAKITGMLLEMDNSELLLLLESPESLAAKVEEAVQVLKLTKTRSRRRRGNSSSSDDDDDDDRKRRKRKSSSREITNEDINEYLARKAQRKALKVAKKLKTETVSGYANDSNPFGDSNLNEKFVWRKKIERDVAQGVPLDELSIKAEKKKQKNRMAEIEKVKKRREERAIEKAQHEEEMAMLARDRARAEHQDWEKKEEEFHFDQSKIRSEIRLREGRIKPIDVLSKHLNGSDDFDIEINEPYMVFKGLTVKEMEELREDIKMHLDLDRATPTHIEFWEALMVVCDWELAEARKRDALDRARVRGEEPPAELLAEERGLHSSVEADVKELLHGKTYSELEVLQTHIESQMRSGTAKVVEYWEAVLKRLHIFKAKACLKEIHTNLLRKHLQRLEHPVESEEDLETDHDSKPQVEDTMHGVEDAQPYSPEPMTNEEVHELEEVPGSFSPELLHGDENEEAIDPEEDRVELERKRMAVKEEHQRRLQEAMASKPTPLEDNLELKAMKAMGVMEEGDAVFGSGAEVNLDSQVYWWHDKYRPRKPKYFNRVHTGYEWNKYNQTHYDHDNPPPKIVQGYKFNIFYPDLVDKSKAPTYTIERDGSSGETCLIRFHAGPPYEDIAFRIVNKEWEYSHKKGFKCTFERGILHVYFNFKRYRYRR
ncbi:RNA recognition motif domain [Macleaya cordata]|uniref:Splicing factor Cactin n=1 Tax=Macleaya cordata TaxID=56857 RepID=A0A200R9P6_MACCD|nr:RNA recognition motif domain [Macleaya cordata]